MIRSRSSLNRKNSSYNIKVNNNVNNQKINEQTATSPEVFIEEILMNQEDMGGGIIGGNKQ